jgi:Ca-activated chloride channel family protein
MIHFLRPYWSLALIPTIILLWYLCRIRAVDNWRTICDSHLLPYLLRVSKRNWLRLPIILLSIGWFLAILALAGPSWEKQTQPIYRSLAARIIILNLSSSMNELTGTTSRLARAKFKILDILQRQKEGLTGLIASAGEPHVVSPLTDDNNTIANLVPVLTPDIMPVPGSDTIAALQATQNLFKQTGITSGNIILVTDNMEQLSPVLQKARTLQQQGFKLFILDMSAQKETHEALQKLATVGGGTAILLTPDNHDIEELLENIKDNHWQAPTKKTNEQGSFWQDQGYWFVLLILPLALVGFRRGYW